MIRRVQIQANDQNAVRVDRATMWGNPFRSDRPTPEMLAAGATSAAEAYRLWLDGHPGLAAVEPERRVAILAGIGRLNGKTLACWCGARDLCHADVLIEMAAKAEPIIGDAVGRPEGMPAMALSVRQPWAWALIHGGKDVENRSTASVRMGSMHAEVSHRIAIHAAKGMTRDEYEGAADTMRALGVTCPLACDLERGGIIGTAFVDAIVSDHASPWFFGPRALVLIEPSPVAFIAAAGALGMFSWSPNYAQPDAPAKWMLPEQESLPAGGRLNRAPTIGPRLFD